MVITRRRSASLRRPNGLRRAATPTQTGISPVARLATHIPAAIRTDGTAWIWGDNLFGQLGNGTTGGEADSPIQIT